MADTTNATSIRGDRPRHSRTPCPARGRLRVGIIVAGAALALMSCFSGAAFAAVPDSGHAGLSVAVKPDKPGPGKPAEGEGKPAHGNSGKSGETERGKPAHGDDRAEDRGDDDRPGGGVGLGRLVRDGLTEEQAGDLAAELGRCLTDDKVDDMRPGQVKRLAHAAGLSTPELRDLLAEDDDSHPGHGLGRLMRDGLDGDQADDVAREARNRLERDDLKDARLGRLLQAAHACGITTQEFKDLLDGD
jgi:hypothetical protein